MPESDATPPPEADAPRPSPAQEPAKDKGMHKVDEATQEQASEEREKAGGYD